MLNKKTVKKTVLIIKIGAIGDVIMALPMIAAILRRDPETKITWVCGKGGASIVEMTKLVDQLIVVDEKKLLEGSFLEKVFAVFEVWKKIGFFRKFSFVIIGYFDVRYRLLTLFTRGKKSALRREKNRENSLETASEKEASQTVFSEEYMPKAYIRLVEENETEDKTSAGKSTSFVEFPKIHIPALMTEDLVSSHQIFKKIETSRKKIALSCGGVYSHVPYSEVRRWPIESYVKLAEGFVNEGYEVILTGSKDDEWILPYFMPYCDDHDHVRDNKKGNDKEFSKDHRILNLIGKTDIKQLLAVYQTCDLVITHDSGALHLAQIAGSKILALFGPTAPHTRVSVFDQSGSENPSCEKQKKDQKIFVLWGGENLLCRPCYHGKFYAPCRKNLCMQTLKPEEVFNKAKEILIL
jgi:heptosyltransferase-2